MKTLALTSPYTRGLNVVVAQGALKRGNIFKADYLQGPQDGIFGESTARACIRAKYWLGYSAGSLKPWYGDKLDAYLTGTEPLGPLMKIRRNRRLKALQEKSLGAKALDIAISHLGVQESPAGSNRVLYSEWYGLIGPWCAMFVSFCIAQVGGKFRYAYVPYIVSDARAGRNGLQVVSYANVRPGDLACFDWRGDGVADHVGIVEKKGAGGNFYSIEGNTGVGNDSNGGEVMRRYRNTGQVQVFVRASV